MKNGHGFFVSALGVLIIVQCLVLVLPVFATTSNPVVDLFLSPDGSKLYATNFEDNSLSIITTDSDVLTNTLTVVGVNPHDVAFSSDGTKAYVVNHGDDSVTVITTLDEEISNTILVGDEPRKVLFTPSGSKAYVVNFGSDSVSVIDTLTETVSSTIEVGNAPGSLAMSPAGDKVYVANGDPATISVIDTVTDTVVNTVSIEPVDTVPPQLMSIVLSDTTLEAGETALVTFTFSESVASSFDNSDITTIDNGTLSVVTDSGDGASWTATLTPTADIADETNVIAVTMEGVSDLGGNPGTGVVSSENYAVNTVIDEFRALIVGDSNARSTRIDTVWAGVPVQSGFTFVDSGVTLTNFPAGSSPGVGMVPFLLDHANDDATSGWVVRRGVNGATSQSYLMSSWAAAKSDVAALNDGAPQVVVFVLGVNDANQNRTQAQAEAFDDNMITMINDAKAIWPEATILVTKESVSPSAQVNPYIWMQPIIYPAIDGLGVNGHATIIDGTACARVDGVHWSVTGTGSNPTYPGQQCVADLIAEVLWPAE